MLGSFTLLYIGDSYVDRKGCNKGYVYRVVIAIRKERRGEDDGRQIFRHLVSKHLPYFNLFLYCCDCLAISASTQFL